MVAISRILPLVALAALLAGCGGSASTATPAVVIDGSSTVFRISQAAQVKFSKESGSRAKILVGNRGTGGGFSRYMEGEVDIVDASRHAKPEEEAMAKERGLDWTRYTVGYDGITIAVNAKNDWAKSLSVEQLRALFAEGSKVTTWKDLDPSWPDRKISLFSPDNDSGTYEFFSEAVLGSGKAAQRKEGVQPSPDDNTLVTGVAGDLDGLGYFGFAYYAANAARLRAVPVLNAGAPEPVAPSPETILSGAYAPLSRPLYIYVKDKAKARPEVAAFLRYYIENIETLATLARYVPPKPADQEANLKALPPAAAAAAPATAPAQ
jgi:phosphate transport system substrate-binding protein